MARYCLGIARLVLLESLRTADREQSAAQGLAISAPPGQAPQPRDLGAFGPAYGRIGEYDLAIAADEETLAFVRAALGPGSPPRAGRRA